MPIALKLTILRIILVPLFIGFVLSYSPDHDILRVWTIVLFTIAIMTDYLDGYFARKQNQRTLAGAMLDPLADKILLISAFICLYKVGGSFQWPVRFPVWLVVTVISRDLIVIIGAILIQLMTGNLKVQPNILGKATTIFQMLCVYSVLLQWPLTMDFGLWGMTAICTIVSGFTYLLSGVKILNA